MQASQEKGPPRSNILMIKNEQGHWNIPSTQRADGSWRKEVRVKQGYTPSEEVSRYVCRPKREQEEQSVRATGGLRNENISYSSCSGRKVTNESVELHLPQDFRAKCSSEVLKTIQESSTLSSTSTEEDDLDNLEELLSNLKLDPDDTIREDESRELSSTYQLGTTNCARSGYDVMPLSPPSPMHSPSDDYEIVLHQLHSELGEVKANIEENTEDEEKIKLWNSFVEKWHWFRSKE